MNKTASVMVTAFCLFGLALPALAKDKLDAAALQEKRKELLKSAGEKVQANKRKLSDYKDDLKTIDEALANAADPKGPGATQLRIFKAQILSFCKDKGCVTVLDEVLSDYPSGPWGELATKIKANYLAEIGDVEGIKALKEKAIKAKMAQSTLGRINASLARAPYAIGKTFPDFKVKDTEGKELSLSQYKGKVVLVDFWATWCGPCMKEMPHVIKAYKKYHPKGFEIIGISFDRSKERLDKVVKEKKMTWRQYFDGQGWKNELGKKYRISSIPTTFLIDKEGKILAKNLRGKQLEEALEKALGDK